MKPRTLEPLPPNERNRPRPSAAEARVRLLDVQMVWDAVAAAKQKPRGARRRAAEKHAVAPATITEAVARFEDAMGVSLFSEAERGGLTAAGDAFLEHGATFLRTYQLLRKFLQEAIAADGCA